MLFMYYIGVHHGNEKYHIGWGNIYMQFLQCLYQYYTQVHKSMLFYHRGIIQLILYRNLLSTKRVIKF